MGSRPVSLPKERQSADLPQVAASRAGAHAGYGGSCAGTNQKHDPTSVTTTTPRYLDNTPDAPQLSAPSRTNRGPYRRKPGREGEGPRRPSVVLAENLRAYRVLRHITQDELAARMSGLGHQMSRSTISAIESLCRSVTVDELLGFVICIGVTIGQLLDATGPEHSRPHGLDVGLRASDGSPRLLAPWAAYLLASSRASVQLAIERGAEIEMRRVGDLPAAAQRELNNMQSSPLD